MVCVSRWYCDYWTQPQNKIHLLLLVNCYRMTHNLFGCLSVFFSCCSVCPGPRRRQHQAEILTVRIHNTLSTIMQGLGCHCFRNGNTARQLAAFEKTFQIHEQEQDMTICCRRLATEMSPVCSTQHHWDHATHAQQQLRICVPAILQSVILVLWYQAFVYLNHNASVAKSVVPTMYERANNQLEWHCMALLCWCAIKKLLTH